MTNRPTHRRLRGYAFDPSISLDPETFDVNNIVYKVRWEETWGKDEEGNRFSPGPCGEYVEVIDFDPTINKFYSPVDLNHPYILATDGLAPSESNPQFHQQMVYAVAMLTIQNFEKALGRKIHWSPRLLTGRRYEQYVPRLRIYPHALREANAYYSPQKKALLFGYFAATPASVAKQMPGSLVFTCLSHDIIAHEVTHAILDGMHRNYNRPTNPDVLAFHEAFADIVALLQHFTFPEVLRHQIAKTRGNLEKQNLLGQLAQEFGTAIGQYGSLRDAIGKIDPETHQWTAAEPDPTDYLRVMEPHARGSILVGAVFDAFLSVYKRRIRDLLRIATSGSGILPEGEIHPDLVNRLSIEASKSASHVLRMCIRALDYCPPVDINFGDYLRGIITADCDSLSEDSRDYRLAFIDAFRRRGIYPKGIKTLSEESLRYRDLSNSSDQSITDIAEMLSEVLRQYRGQVMYCSDRKEIYEISRKFIAGNSRSNGFHALLSSQLENAHDYEQVAWEFGQLTGLVIQYWQDYGIGTSRGGPAFQVLDLHVVSRSGPDGDRVNHIVFGLVQRMGVIPLGDGKFGNYVPSRSNSSDHASPPEDGFEIQGGCTMIFDLDSLALKYSITKPLLSEDQQDADGWPEINLDRVRAQHEYQQEALPLSMSEVARYFGAGLDSHFGEPFSLLHIKEPRNA
jgi:hypothetical protein